MDASAVLASAEDRAIDAAVAVLAQRDRVRQSPCPDERRRDVRQLFRLVLRCMHAGRAEPVIRPSEQIAAHCYAAGIDLTEVQEAFNVLTEVLWRHLADAPGRRAVGSGARGRLPINVIKEMFFTAAPIDARKAKEWLLINHLVPWDRLESFTLELAATMATKSPLAIAVIKEQLRVLSDYQPIAAQVYERVQALRREAYDSSDYVEGLNAFAEKRQPVFRGS